MKKLLALLCAAAMLLGMATACSTTDSYTIGVCQLVAHPALDAATQGFVDAVNEALGEDNVTWEIQNAANDIPTCSTITNGFAASKVDLIIANATPALQAAVAGTGEIPILCTSVTEYGAALDIENFDGTVGGNISGTSDLTSLDEQAAMIQEWFPEAKTVGMLYCSSEANSLYQVEVVQDALVELGYTCLDFPFVDSTDLGAVCTAASEVCDVIFVPTDNTVAANAGIIDNVCRPAKVPVMGGDNGICASCGVAALPISYYELGRITGEMAAQILTGEADISTMPIEYTTAVKTYNPEICEALGLAVPEGYTPVVIAE